MKEQALEHSYEEIRNVVLDILSGREDATRYEVDQFEHLHIAVAAAFCKRDGNEWVTGPSPSLATDDLELLREVFWDLFRQGIITLGRDNANRQFPFFRVSRLGQKILDAHESYFFHDVTSYEKVIRQSIPNIDTVTLLFLKEAMQAFQAGCILSSSVMLGVATEHTFLLLLEKAVASKSWGSAFATANKERTLLQKFNKFTNKLRQQAKELPSQIREDLDTDFAGVLSMIRNFRNQSGHPSGRIIGREQAYVLLQLFVTCCKKMYQLMDYFSQN